MDAYTLSPLCRKRIFATVLFARNSDSESWNQGFRMLTHMNSHTTNRQEVHYSRLAALLWNELKQHKVEGVGQLKKSAKKGKGKLKKKGQVVPLKVRKPHVFNVHTQMYRSMFAGVHSIERWADVKDKNLSDSRVARKHYVRDKTEKRRRNLQRLRGRARRREAELLRRRGEGQLVPQYTAAAQVHHKLPHFMRTQEFVDTHRPHWPFVDADFSASEDSEEESEREPDGTSADHSAEQ